MKKRLFISMMCAVLLSAAFVTSASAFKAEDNAAADNGISQSAAAEQTDKAMSPEDVYHGDPVIEYDTDVYYADAAPMALVERGSPHTVDLLDTQYLEEAGRINLEWVNIRDTAAAEMTDTDNYNKTGLEERISELTEQKKRLAKNNERDRIFAEQTGAAEDAPIIVDEDDIRSKATAAWIKDLAEKKADAAKYDALLSITKKYGYTVKTVEGKELTGKDIRDYAYYIPALMVACCNAYNDESVNLSSSENARIVSFLAERTNIMPELCQTNEQFGIAVNFMNRTIVFPKDMF